MWKNNRSKCKNCNDNNLIIDNNNLKCTNCGKLISSKLFNNKKLCFRCDLMNYPKNYYKNKNKNFTKNKKISQLYKNFQLDIN